MQEPVDLPAPKNSPSQGEGVAAVQGYSSYYDSDRQNVINSLQILQQAFKEKREDALKLFLITSEMCQKKQVKHYPGRIPFCFTQAPWRHRRTWQG